LHLGYGAALSLILAAIILVFTIVQMALTRRSEI
jgi:multiple sugar transport system permease protein